MKLSYVLWAALVASGTALAGDRPVSVTVEGGSYVLSNSYVTATIDQKSGDLVSLKYRGLECMGHDSGYPAGHWEQDTSAAPRRIDSITIDPKSNGGERGEVSVKGISEGKMLGAEAAGGGTRCDIEIRYALGRHDSGVYTYAAYTHPADYPEDHLGESRFGAKLNPEVFDWMTINARINRQMPAPQDWVKGTELNMKEARRLTTGLYKGQVEHKYDYSAIQSGAPAFGWSSTHDHVGLWFINPSMEYLSGGPTKIELTGHLDLTSSPDPVLLDYWRGTHYGGSYLSTAKGEVWDKVVGPIFVYCNGGGDPQALWHDALRQAEVEAGHWPYPWVGGVDYPQARDRSSVGGRLALDDPQKPGLKPDGMWVGLSAPDYTTQGFRGEPTTVDWQNDAKHYEFWVRADSKGRFLIPNVRAGSYVLHAISDGVLGEFAKADIVVPKGGHVDLGKLTWTPVRYGRQLWEIGVPNRSAKEFFHGDDANHWGLYFDYAKWFPNDVTFVVGKSDYRKDWNFEQVPHYVGDPGNGRVTGNETTWKVRFDLPEAPKGKAVLRLALCGVSTLKLEVRVNGGAPMTVSGLHYNAVINRDGNQGYWSEHDVGFDASQLVRGANELTLTVPAGNPTSGIEYDYLRLELVSP